MDTINAGVDGLGNWLIANESAANLVTLWCLCIGYLSLSISKARTWEVIHYQHDRTPVGTASKRQVLADVFKNLGQSTLYGIALVLYYFGPGAWIGIWERMGVRAVVIVSLAFAVFFNFALNWALKQENWGRPDPEARSP